MKCLRYGDEAQGNWMMKDSFFAPSLITSIGIHLAALISVSVLVGHRNQLPTRDLIPVSLLEPPPQEERPTPARDKESLPVKKKLEPAAQPQQPQKPLLPSKREQAVVEPPAPVRPKEEAAKSSDNNASPPPPMERVLPERAGDEGGGAPAGARAFSSQSESGVTPGSGSAGGGGNAVAGLGRGSDAPGLPAPSGPLRTNREAKPTQIARAVYPPMALRMGMESDVTLRIEVDPTGSVTKAEITKSGGAGFDEEALKAVKQSRFEPAQREGRNVPAEFTYLYRFRLHR
jgi:protein TonB